MHNMKVVRN